MVRMLLFIVVLILPVAGYTQTDPTRLSVDALAKAIAEEELTAVEVTQAFLARIASIDDSGPKLNAVIEINPDALAIAKELDQVLAKSGPVGPLHGVPVILKANIDTGDKMITSAGALVLADHRAPEDAFHVAQLRKAGAVILAKANLSEWANFRSEQSSSGWSTLGGQTKNPYALDRNPCGSSSGSGAAVSARLAPLAVGTETNGSIVCPAGINGIVGIKPTVGLISRSGIIPISFTQDTAGPMANTVVGAAMGLDAMVGRDRNDSKSVKPPHKGSYVPDLDKTDLKGVRVGVWRGHYGADIPDVKALLDQNIERLRNLGADIVDPIEMKSPGSIGPASYQVLLFEFKDGLNAYLDSHPVQGSINTLEKIIEFNRQHPDQVMPIFGQDILELSQSKGDLESDDYKTALADSHEAMKKAMDEVFARLDLDVIIASVNSPAWKTDWANGDNFQLSSSRIAAISGYPSVAVPAGFVDELPIGMAFIGLKFSEAALLQYAYAFEQDSQARRDPQLLPRLAVEESQ